MLSKSLNLIAVFFSLLIIGLVKSLSVTLNLAPCPLCQIEQLLIAVIGFVCLLAYFHKPPIQIVRYYGIITFCLALIGMGMAGRQWWLHLHPKIQVATSTCGADIFYLIQATSLKTVASSLWVGAGACEEAGISILYIPLPAWAFLSFGILSIIGLMQTFFPKIRKGD